MWKPYRPLIIEMAQQLNKVQQILRNLSTEDKTNVISDKIPNWCSSLVSIQ